MPWVTQRVLIRLNINEEVVLVPSDSYRTGMIVQQTSGGQFFISTQHIEDADSGILVSTSLPPMDINYPTHGGIVTLEWYVVTFGAGSSGFALVTRYVPEESQHGVLTVSQANPQNPFL